MSGSVDAGWSEVGEGRRGAELPRRVTRRCCPCVVCTEMVQPAAVACDDHTFLVTPSGDALPGLAEEVNVCNLSVVPPASQKWGQPVYSHLCPWSVSWLAWSLLILVCLAGALLVPRGFPEPPSQA